MEEFEHMIVEEFNEEDFYETIEAPKFVDLSAPDHRPEGDDRYWFCSRVGCDQKHEEFMDSEAIYKKFLLRVMAARSPSVRLRKALYRKDFSVEPKCPNTVPAKPSRSRVSKLAMISSIHQKGNGNMRSNKNATPKAKVKGKETSVISSVPQKALTERKKQMQSPAAFRSVQDTRSATTRVTQNRVVAAKALVFDSPKKLVKLKRSVELSSSVKKLCNGMRKLETENQRRNGLGVVVNHKAETSVPSKRQRKGREVKSRVFDSVRPKKQIDEKAKGTLKQRVKQKEEPLLSSDPLKTHEANGIELKNQSLPRSEKPSGDEEFLIKNMDREDHAVMKESGLDTPKQYQIAEIEDKENALPLECEKKKNAAIVADVVDRENDDKENSSALDNNRKESLLKKKAFGKKETCKTTQKAMTVADKCFNVKTVSANTRVKYTKPKLTNPKPFRLRTDERRILKEANTEKKPQCALAKEEGEETTKILRFHGENLGPKHQPFTQLEKNTTSRSKAFRGTSTTTRIRHDPSENMVDGKRVVASGRKKKVETMEEEASRRKGESKEAAIINKPSVSDVALGEKRPATIPKGPNFHSIHVPKNCTKRVASQV